MEYILRFLDIKRIRVLFQSYKFRKARFSKAFLSIFHFLEDYHWEKIINKDWTISFNDINYIQHFSFCLAEKFMVNDKEACEHIYRFLLERIAERTIKVRLSADNNVEKEVYKEFFVHFKDKIEIVIDLKKSLNIIPQLPEAMPASLLADKYLSSTCEQDLKSLSLYKITLKSIVMEYSNDSQKAFYSGANMLVNWYEHLPDTLIELKLRLGQKVLHQNMEPLYHLIQLNINSLTSIDFLYITTLHIEDAELFFLRLVLFLSKCNITKEIKVTFQSSLSLSMQFYNELKAMKRSMGMIKLNICGGYLNSREEYEILSSGLRSDTYFVVDYNILSAVPSKSLSNLNNFTVIKANIVEKGNQVDDMNYQNLCTFLQCQNRLEELIISIKQSETSKSLIERLSTALSKDNIKFQKLRFIHWPEDYDLQLLKVLRSKFSSLSSFILSRDNGITIRSLEKNLKFQSNQSSETILRLAEQFTNQKWAIKLRRVNNNFNAEIIESNTWKHHQRINENICELSIFGRSYNNDYDYAVLILKKLIPFSCMFPNLRSLKIKNYHTYQRDWDKFALIVHNFPLLEILELKKNNVGDEEMKKILSGVCSYQIRKLKIQAGKLTLEYLHSILLSRFRYLTKIKFYIQDKDKSECQELVQAVLDTGKEIFLFE